MVNIYDEFRYENGFHIPGRTKLFIRETSEDGTILKPISGIAFVVEENGTQFIVDDWLIPQIDKVKFVDGVLSVKDGEELIPPVKTDKQKEMEELQRRMAELQATTDEPTDTEEQLLLENTEEPAPE